ncbi:glutamate racemase [Blastochloris sulfoviridis]|uniref:Glutamate racemase n=1 Tax=Blastochloris sulfoviridis TaxID=50712 RepID=A0A5M6I3E7_9HYPH|nr:glutamate racemase [Blastochloris sulfoviridis]KAA5602736.1 glutamate racemase [Blastochloris sulfoviridis]
MPIEPLPGTVRSLGRAPSPLAPTIVPLPPVAIALRDPLILVFDSGLGGLTVLAEVATARPDARIVYVADDAGFPYGPMAESALIARVAEVLGQAIRLHKPDVVVVACNTASTLVLPHLRAAHPAVRFVGTVPAIKPACEGSRTGRVSVLATPGTVRRDYTHELIRRFAGACRVTLVGSALLAGFAEAFLRGHPIDDEAIAAEIAPCFVEGPEGARTDTVVLACTHYPLLVEAFRDLAPWPVRWVDPAPAIARRVVQLIGPSTAGAVAAPGRVVFTGGRMREPGLAGALRRFRLEEAGV